MAKAIIPLPSVDVLNSILVHDIPSGTLYWKERTQQIMEGVGLCVDERQITAWNTLNAGKEAFKHINNSGYKVGSLFRRKVLAHRIIWKMAHGYDPRVIDHINGDKIDNRLSNLRDCTVEDNSRNYHKRESGASDFRGVVAMESGRWGAQISAGSQGKFWIGNFDDEEAAARAYDEAAARYHGEFATLNFPRALANEAET